MSVKYVLGSSFLNCFTNAPAPAPAATVPTPKAARVPNLPLSKFGFSFIAVKNLVAEFLTLLNDPSPGVLLTSFANFSGFLLKASSTSSTHPVPVAKPILPPAALNGIQIGPPLLASAIASL